MPEQTPAVGMERKLAAIFSMDVAGYSRLMGDDEEATILTLTSYRALISSLIQHYRGRVIDAPGDNLLAEFASVVDAVRSAIEIQHTLQTKNAELPAHRQMQFRIGINLGDVIVEGERLYGDGVNIAARLESLAPPGGICISGTVYDQIETKLALQYDYQGEQTVKNIAKPVRVYRVQLEPRPAPPSALSGEQPALLPLPDKPSLAVLPFTNLSSDPEQEYFSDGLTEDLITDLSRLSGLFVIARHSTFTYEGEAVKVQEVSRDLGVRYVLEGSVRKVGERVRITAQLIEAPAGHHLWAERYDRPLQDIFALQDEIVQQIVTTLRLQLTLQEQGVIVRKHTAHLAAYDAFLRGVAYGWRLTKDDNARARHMFEQAAALDAQYAEAYTWLGWTYLLDWMNSWSADPQTLERALALEQQALALDDSLPGAHSLLGFVYAQQQQYEHAIAEGERAIALDPNNADSYAFHGEVLRFAGRPEDTLRMLGQAMRLNPRCPPFYVFFLGLAYHETGRYTEAVATLKDHLSRSPTNLAAHLFLALSYVQQWASQQSATTQILEQAGAAQRAIASTESIPSWGHTIWGFVYLWQKQYEHAIAEGEQAIALDPHNALGYASLAETLSRVGRPEEAVARAEQALRRKPVEIDVHLSGVGAAYHLAGRPEEAVAPLKQYLTRYPDVLGAHLILAAVYSELGREAEARTEAVEVLRLNPSSH